MSEQKAVDQYRISVGKQVDVMLTAVAEVMMGNLDITFPAPQGAHEDDPLADLTIALNFLVEDVRDLLREKERANEELDQRVQERTHELQETLDELQRVQRRYVQGEWRRFSDINGRSPIEGEWQTAVEQAVNNRSVATVTNESGGQALAVPIQYTGEVIGVLGFGNDQIAEWDDDELTAVQDIAEQVGLALENQRLYDQSQMALAEAQRRGEELQALNQVVSAVAKTLDLGESMQAIAEELARAINAPQIGIALIDEDNKNLTLVADYWDREHSIEAIGTKIPIEGNLLTQEVIATRQPIIVRDAQNDPRTAPVHELMRKRGTFQLTLLPILAGDEVIGTVGIDEFDPTKRITDDELRLAEMIIYQITTAVQNAQLFERTQEALAETETFYNISSNLNKAASIKDVLNAIKTSPMAKGSSVISYSRLETDSQGTPKALILEDMLLMQEIPDQVEMPIASGARFELEQYSFSENWINNPTRVTFVENIETDDRMDELSRMVLMNLQTLAMAIMPIYYAGKWLGLIQVIWDKPWAFDIRERRLFNASAEQIVVVVNQLNLLEQTQNRANQLATLSEIEKRLSQAQSEDDILTAVAQVIENPHALALRYIEVDGNGDPLLIRTVSRWEEGQIIKHPDDSKSIPINEWPGKSVWINTPGQVQIVENLPTSTISDHAQKVLSKRNMNSFMVMPLLSVGRWQGILTATWPSPRTFNENERFMLQQLVEPAAAFVASRRSFLETEQLYQASLAISEASEYEDALEALRQHTILGRNSNAVTIVLFDEIANDGKLPTWGIPVASHSDLPPELQAPRYYLPAFPNASHLLKPDRPLILEDLSRNTLLDEASYQLIVELARAQSAIFLPLSAGGQWYGFIYAQYPQKMRFSADDLRSLNAVAGQTAVAIRSITLLEEAQSRARREQVLREIGAKVRNATSVESVMRIAAQEVGNALGRQTVVSLAALQPESKTLSQTEDTPHD